MPEYVYDPELLAMSAILKIVGDFTDEQRARVFAWVNIRCSADTATPAVVLSEAA